MITAHIPSPILKHSPILSLVVGLLLQLPAMAGVLLCPRDTERPEIQIRFFDTAQVRIQDADDGHEIAHFDSQKDGTHLSWQSPEGMRGCYLIQVYLAAASDKEAVCLANDEDIGYAVGAQSELAALIHYRGARLETRGAPCGDMPSQRSGKQATPLYETPTLAKRKPPPSKSVANGNHKSAANGNHLESETPAFAWPPPRPSTRRTLARYLPTGGAEAPTLEVVAGRLQNALEANGYVEYSYYSVPDGFALATRLERIYPDGRSMPEPARWQTTLGPLRHFVLAEYLRALFDAELGSFRVIVFIVSPAPLTSGAAPPSTAAALAWPREGVPVLPNALRQILYSENYQTHALIYEFETRGQGQQAKFKESSSITGDVHLRRAKILGSLQP